MDSKPRERLQQKTLLRFGSDLIAGGVSGIVAKTVSAPIERVKLLLQTQHINTTLTVQYKGPINCIRRLYTEEGILSFWRGNLANVYRYFPNQAICFAFKDKYKEIMVLKPSGNASTDRWKMIVNNLASGGLAGGTATTLTFPFELARTRLAVDSGSTNRQYTGTADCLRKTYMAEGLRGVYAGLAISLGGAILFRGLFMGGYDITKSIYDLEHSSIYVRLMAAQMVTLLSGTLCYPIDTVKRRMMVQKGHVKGDVLHVAPSAVYRNSFDCFRRIVREEGAKGLFSGLSVNLVRGISGALLLVGYDEVKIMFRNNNM